MTRNEKELIEVLKDLKIKFSPSLNSEGKLLEVVVNKILENPDVSELKVSSLKTLEKYGFSLIHSDGTRIKLD